MPRRSPSALRQRLRRRRSRNPRGCDGRRSRDRPRRRGSARSRHAPRPGRACDRRRGCRCRSGAGSARSRSTATAICVSLVSRTISARRRGPAVDRRRRRRRARRHSRPRCRCVRRTPPGAALGRKRTRMPSALQLGAPARRASSTSRNRKLPPPLRTASTIGEPASSAGEPLAVGLDPRDPLRVDRRGATATSAASAASMRQARQRIGRQRARDQRDQLGIADRAADPRAGQAIGLGQGAQHDQIRRAAPPRRRGSRASENSI